jgi:hypothetical protein
MVVNLCHLVMAGVFVIPHLDKDKSTLLTIDAPIG